VVPHAQLMDDSGASSHEAIARRSERQAQRHDILTKRVCVYLPGELRTTQTAAPRCICRAEAIPVVAIL
jgi:hypothetical protein